MRKPIAFIWLPFSLSALLFLGIKLHSLGIRASDTNIYFYTAKELLSGKILYKDVFFTNCPLIPYVASFYFLISGGNLIFYYFTAALESVITAGVIYYLSYNQTTSRFTATLTSCVYLFSFLLLSTSDHQTGVFLAALFATLSYFFFTTKRFVLVGIFTAMAILTKAYSLPLLLSYAVFLLLTQRKQIIPFIIGGVTTTFVILLPSLILARQDLLRDVISYSLTRSQGISKIGIIYFVFQHDTLFLILLLASLLLIKKHLFFGLFSLFSLAFFLLYKDVYYLYLNVTLPLICLTLPPVLNLIEKRFSLNRYFLPSLIFLFILYNLIVYFSGFATLQRLPIDQITQTISQQKTAVLYGVNGITPALAYTNHRQLLEGIVDTNDNIFRKGYLNATRLTQEAINQHAMVVTQGAWYPDQGIKQDVMTEIVDTKLLIKNCHVLHRFPFQSEGVVNSITLFSC